MTGNLDQGRLLAVIETQNEIASTALEVEAVMQFVAERARELTRASGSVIELPEGDEMVYKVATGTAAQHVGLRLQIDGSLSGRCLREERVLLSVDTANDDRVHPKVVAEVGARSLICVPLRHGGTVAGVLKVMGREPHAFDDGDVQLLGLLSGVIAAHMAHATHFEVVRKQSLQDPLTGLGNRRAFDGDLDEAMRVAKRRERTVALCLFDIDQFKLVNDTHGHPAGDAVLTGIAAILRSSRAGDRAYRLGGDEFALLLPETTSEGAHAACHRVTAAIASQPIAGIPISISTGYAEAAPHQADGLYAAADSRLYESKALRQASA